MLLLEFSINALTQYQSQTFLRIKFARFYIFFKFCNIFLLLHWIDLILSFSDNFDWIKCIMTIRYQSIW